MAKCCKRARDSSTHSASVPGSTATTEARSGYTQAKRVNRRERWGNMQVR